MKLILGGKLAQDAPVPTYTEGPNKPPTYTEGPNKQVLKMKLVFEINPKHAQSLLTHMEEQAEDAEHYAHFRDSTWTTVGGSKYTVDVSSGTLTYNGSRTSLVNGAGFGGVIDAQETLVVYLAYSVLEFPIKLLNMETTWRGVEGWDNPFCTEAELIHAQELEEMEETLWELEHSL